MKNLNMKLKATTLIDAIIEAQEIAKQDDYYNSVSLCIHVDSTFHIGERCNSNVLFSTYAVTDNKEHTCILTIPYLAMPIELLNWDLLVFCSKFQIKINNREFINIFGVKA